MKKVFLFRLACVCMLSILVFQQAKAADPDRSILVMSKSGDAFISWRILSSDPGDISFNIYRKNDGGSQAVKLNAQPINSTNFLDTDPPSGSDATWYVKPVINGTEGQACIEQKMMNNNGNPYFEFDLVNPGDFMAASVGDITGDGLSDYIIQQPKSWLDPYCSNWQWTGDGTFKLYAYDHYGNHLWTFDRGNSIEKGPWYAPWIVYDFDQDGTCEIALKGSDGDYRSADGRVYTGPEHLYILDGPTGNKIAQIDWHSRDGYRAEPCEEGEPWAGYNLQCRNLLSVAYIDGTTPHIIMTRGTYGYHQVGAYKFDGSSLTQAWYWTNEATNGSDGIGSAWKGQGGHVQHGADVDGDGKDEVILGSYALDDDGTPLWTTGLGHIDGCYVGEIDVNNPGLEMYYACEWYKDSKGMGLLDAETGQHIWYFDERTEHCHREGMVGDIDRSSPGLECYSQSRDNGAIKYLWSSTGNLISHTEIGEKPRAIYWGSDFQERIIDYQDAMYTYNNGSITKIMDFPGRIVAIGDFLGDWREEVVAQVDGKLRIYATLESTSYKRTCLMEDRTYNTQVSAQTMGYMVNPLTGYDVSSEVEPVEDCNGDLGGSAYIDECGECVGGNTGNTPCVVDCNGDQNGSAYIDNCDNCVGGNTGEEPCAVVSHYEVDFSDPDDDYTINGSATNSNPTNEIINGRYALSAMEATFESELINIEGLSNVMVSVDIEASPTSEFEEADYCNVYYKLNGGSLTPISENVAGFSLKTASATGLSGNTIQVVIQTKNSHEMEFHYLDNIIVMGEGGSTVDCNGDENGDAYIDNCGTCVGGNTGLQPCANDCNGDPGGSASIDQCGVCSGGNTGLVPDESCTDCNGDVNGDAYIDGCGTCVGGNSGMEPCTEPCNLSITNLNPSSFAIVDAAEGVTYYNDRSYTITTLPSVLSGSKLIKTNNDEEGSTVSTYLSFDINANAEIYIGYDNRVTSTPDWMDSYSPIGETVIISDRDCNLNLYKLAANAGTITCGGNNASGASGAESNYVVFVKEDCSGSTTDCNGDEGGSASIDQCGECSGGNTGLVPNESCTDCNGDINGDAYIDGCGICVGGNTGLEPCSTGGFTSWEVDFSDPDGQYSVSTSEPRTDPFNEIRDGRYAFSACKVLWESEIINIDGATVDISLDIEGQDATAMEEVDFLNVYYIVDGGSRIAISENIDGFALKTVSVDNVSGNTLQIVIEGQTSSSGSGGAEIYYIDNILVGNIQIDSYTKSGKGISRSGQSIDLTSEPGIYPNPFDTYIEISNAHGNIKLYDMYGRVVYQENNVQGDLRIETESLPRGLYLLQIESKNKTELIELVK